MSIIPDEFISGTPDTPNSPVTNIRPTGDKWIVPVPKKPTDPKPSVTIKLTDDPEGVELIEVELSGNVAEATILAQLPGSEEFQPVVGGTNIIGAFIYESFDKVKAIKVILEFPRLNLYGEYPENYRISLEIAACFHPTSKYKDY